MNKPEIDSIVARILGGDIDAYEAIVSSYQQEVWKVVAAMLLNAQRTEDLVEQTSYGQIIHPSYFSAVILPLFLRIRALISHHALEKVAGLCHWANR